MNKPKSKVYDCFMFNDELDVLSIRLAELNDVVDVFVIVESNFTHSGLPKPLHYKENEHLFAQYAHKIRHYVYDYPHPTDNAWHRESHQRDACIQGLYDASDYDIIISGDADEIPRKEVIMNYDPTVGVRGVETKYYFYFLNCERQDKGTTHQRLLPFWLLKPYTFCFFRYKDYPMIENGGWHFSFIGDVKQIKKKLQSYAHQEYNTPHFTDEARLEQMINAGQDILEKGMVFNFVKIDDKFPVFLQQNVDTYIKKGLIKTDAPISVAPPPKPNPMPEIRAEVIRRWDAQAEFEKPVKLNLGCGGEILEGYINCDINSDNPAVVKMDILKLPYDDNSVDEVRAYHVIEHFPYHKGIEALREWTRVLKSNGKITLETPDLLNTCKRFVEGDEITRVGLYAHFFAFGDISPYEQHSFLYTENQLIGTLQSLGFVDVQRVEPDSAYAKDDPSRPDLYLKVTAVKK